MEPACIVVCADQVKSEYGLVLGVVPEPSDALHLLAAFLQEGVVDDEGARPDALLFVDLVLHHLDHGAVELPSSQVESVMKLFIEVWFLYSRNDLLMDETFFLSGMAMSPVRYLIAFSTCLRSSKPDSR